MSYVIPFESSCFILSNFLLFFPFNVKLDSRSEVSAEGCFPKLNFISFLLSLCDLFISPLQAYCKYRSCLSEHPVVEIILNISSRYLNEMKLPLYIQGVDLSHSLLLPMRLISSACKNPRAHFPFRWSLVVIFAFLLLPHCLTSHLWPQVAQTVRDPGVLLNFNYIPPFRWAKSGYIGRYPTVWRSSQ